MLLFEHLGLDQLRDRFVVGYERGGRSRLRQEGQDPGHDRRFPYSFNRFSTNFRQ
jgi:hypothetical protein